MLLDASAMTSIPMTDWERAKKFYHETLGLDVTMENPNAFIVKTSAGDSLFVYLRNDATKAEHTICTFSVDEIEAEVKMMKNAGVNVIDYDTPGFKTTDGVFEAGTHKLAWFNDSEGNILGLSNRR